MAPARPFPSPQPPAGQLVRAPAATDGIGHALRQSFGREPDMPCWARDCLDRLDRRY